MRKTMRQIHHLALMLVAVVASVILTACGKDYQDDIDELNDRHAGIEQRVTKIENQVKTFNAQVEALAALSVAVEQNFYITSVETTTDGYQLTLSNGRIIVLQSGPDNVLMPMPAVSMTQINGFFYWTLNGVVLTDDDGRPIRTTDVTPVVKYDQVTLQWLISIDGGVTFQTVDAYASIVINNEVLLQILNTYVSRYSTTVISQDILYQVISTYIQQNYSLLFDVKKLHQTIFSYVHNHYSAVFSYELLEKIFSQYNYEYYTNQVDVDQLIDLILSFMREHQEVFVNNEVLYEIFTNYMTLNKTTVFDDQLLLEVFNNFVQNNENYIDVDLLREVIYNYLDQHQDVIVNNELVFNLLIEYVQNNYVQIFDQQILAQLFSKYITLNFSTIFNETLIREIINTYVQNNYNTFIDNETIHRIINNYITENETTVISRDLLVDIVTKYFQVNYNIFVKSIDIENIINTYVESHQTTLFDVDILQEVVLDYLRVYYNEVFNYSFLEEIITNYFNNTTVINEYISRYTGVINDIKLTDDYCEITYNNKQKVRLVVFDEYARLRDRVQSIVVMPDGTGHVTETKTEWGGDLHLKYSVTPAAMASVLYHKYYSGELSLELKTTDEQGNIGTLTVRELTYTNEGTIYISAQTPEFGAVKTVALHVKENRVGGTDFITEFTVVDAEFDPRIIQTIPEEYLRRMRPYMPIYSGNTPPVIEGTYKLSKNVLVYSSDGYQSDNFADHIAEFTSQDMIQNTVVYREETRGSTVLSSSERQEAIVLGKGDNFTVFIILDSKRNDEYGTTTKMATILSGTKTTSGIKDFYYGFVMLDKYDPAGIIMEVGEFRIFKDEDGFSEPTTWMARQYLTAPGTTTRLEEPCCVATKR